MAGYTLTKDEEARGQAAEDAADAPPPYTEGSTRGDKASLPKPYEEMFIYCDPDPTINQLRAIQTDRLEPMTRALGELIVGWHLFDKQGAPISYGDWGPIGLRLLKAMTEAYMTAMKAAINVPLASSTR